MKAPFEEKDIEDVRIIIYAKGKHWGIVPKEGKRERAASFRKSVFPVMLACHRIVDKPLEEIDV